MAAKTVALDAEAYELLRRQRRSGVTFSQAVKRIAGRRKSILEFAGMWQDIPDEDFQKIRAALAEGRKRDRERFERLFGTHAKP